MVYKLVYKQIWNKSLHAYSKLISLIKRICKKMIKASTMISFWCSSNTYVKGWYIQQFQRPWLSAYINLQEMVIHTHHNSILPEVGICSVTMKKKWSNAFLKHSQFESVI